MKALQGDRFRTGSYHSATTLTRCTLKGHTFQDVINFMAHVQKLMMNLARIPSEEDMFDWLFENFRSWPPILDEVKAINRAAHGHPT
eukprot:1909450-Karenia_brevis.AAC.1